MDTRIITAVAGGSGLVTAATLRGLAIDPRVISALVRSGDLIAVRRGVYTTAELWSSWDEWHDRPLARIRAVHLTITVDHRFSHDSSAILHALPLIDPRASGVHVTREGVVGSQVRHGVRHHGAPYTDGDEVEVEGLAALAIPRTVADLSRTHGYAHGLAAADAALRRGITRAQLAAATDAMVAWPGVTVARSVVRDADPGAESLAETLARILVNELGIGDVETQFPVRTVRGVRWCDLRVGCHLFEVDGRIKIIPVEDGGVAAATAQQVLWDEKKRERDVTSRGLGMSRIVWQDYWEPHRSQARRRLKAEYAHTCQHYGTGLPAELAADAQRLRDLRPRRTG